VEWYCVRIEQQRLARVINLTFRNMLLEEYRDLGQPDNCRVYRRIHPDGSHTYLFSPDAADVMKIFVDFWEGSAVAEPTAFDQMEVVI
jgi:hypothetical protein